MSRKKKTPSLPKNIKVGDVLEVVWEDHFSTGKWSSRDQALNEDSYIVESTGYYLGTNPKAQGLVLAQNHVKSSTTISDTITILWANIQSITRIKRAT